MLSFNHEVAQNLRKISFLLKEQHANPFRCQAYLKAAITIEALPQDLRQLFKNSGIKGLTQLPNIGLGIARSINDYITMGHMTRLDNLRGNTNPIDLFQIIPTLGQGMAQRIHDTLHVDTLEAFENAIFEGQLGNVKGIGVKRKKAIEAWFAQCFGTRQLPITTHHQPIEAKPSIELIFNIDAQYRKKAKAGELPVITPKRFNPENKPWLPVMHINKENWHFTAMYSNTQRAHKLNLTLDWVLIFCYDEHHQESQYTLVTETHGPLRGKRVIRGQEAACEIFYTTKNDIKNFNTDIEKIAATAK